MTPNPEMLRRVSETYPAPTLVDGLPVRPWLPIATITEDWGTYRIEIGAVWEVTDGVASITTPGTDVTFVRGARTKVVSYALEEPYGCGPAAFFFPLITGYDFPATFPWLVEDANVDLYRVAPDGLTESFVWCGILTPPSFPESVDSPGGVFLHADGDLQGEAAARMCQPQMLGDERDIGSVIARSLDPLSYSRPLPPLRVSFAADTTEITTRKRGSRNQSMLDHIDELLALAQDGNGQWTISRGYGEDDRPQGHTYYMRRKGPIQTNTVTYGGRGVTVDLVPGARRITTIYGEGIDPRDSSHWKNARYPNLNPRPAPAYPTRVTGTGPIALGDTDADFGPADSITRLTAVMRADGWPDVEVSSVVTADTVTAFIAASEDLLGVFQNCCDETLWDALWAVEGVGTPTALSSGYYAPLASDPRTEKWLYYADGSIRGANDTGPTAYDPAILRSEAMINFGEACQKSRGRNNSRHQLAREDLGNLVGTVTLKGVSPEERDIRDVKEGSRLVVRHWRGSAGVTLHVASVVIDPEAETATLKVSQAMYDHLALSQVIARSREAKNDPARSLWARNRSSKQTLDGVGWDKESGAGLIPHISLDPGWSVLKMVGAQVGTLATMTAHVTPASEFTMALFGKPITAAEIAAIVPDPLADPGDYVSLWDDPAIQDALDAAKFIEHWGSKEEPCGYAPGSKSGGTGNPITGKMADKQPLAIASLDPPFLYVPVFATEAVVFALRSRIVTVE
jgi:hypothetical protein